MINSFTVYTYIQILKLNTSLETPCIFPKKIWIAANVNILEYGIFF